MPIIGQLIQKNKPSVVLAFTVKGYGMGSRQADNAAHQIKKLSKENLQDFVEHFNLPISEKELDNPSYLSLDSKEEKKYLINQRKKLGGFLPSRKTADEILSPEDGLLDEFSQQSKRELSTTMVFVRILTKLLRDKNIGERVVPIVPDEARTFGMIRYLDSLESTHLKAKNMNLKILIKLCFIESQKAARC